MVYFFSAGKGKGGADAGSAPTTEQLHAVVSTILKEVDFNTVSRWLSFVFCSSVCHCLLC
jgi:hypothetical protein